MKMMITATAVGAAIAGIILYYQKKSKPQNKVMEAAEDAYQVMNDGIGRIERPAHHAMG